MIKLITDHRHRCRHRRCLCFLHFFMSFCIFNWVIWPFEKQFRTLDSTKIQLNYNWAHWQWLMRVIWWEASQCHSLGSLRSFVCSFVRSFVRRSECYWITVKFFELFHVVDVDVKKSNSVVYNIQCTVHIAHCTLHIAQSWRTAQITWIQAKIMCKMCMYNICYLMYDVIV